MGKYDDIINLDRPISSFPKISMSSRAAQFSPFAALNGYDDQIKETGRLTDKQIELDDEAKLIINDKLVYLSKNIKKNIEVTITYFIKDKNKDGGKYVSEKGMVNKIDKTKRIIYLNNNKILINNIIDIESEVFKDREL